MPNALHFIHQTIMKLITVNQKVLNVYKMIIFWIEF